MEPDQWLGIELRHLAALEAVAREGSFHRAAKRLGYSQSALSGQIALLERIVGERLVERPGGRTPVYLTESGELVRRHAERIVAQLAAARADVEAVADGTAGVLHIGTYQSVGARLLPEIMREFAATWPDVEMRLEESLNDQELTRWVETGEVDLTFMSFPIGEGPFVATELMIDPYVVVVPEDSPLALRNDPPTLRDVVRFPLIGYRSHEGREALERRLRTRGVEPTVAFRSDDNGTVHSLVAAGFGVALIPRLSVDPNRTDVRVLELASRLTPRLVGIAWHRDRYQIPAAKAFIETARDVAKRLYTD